MTLNQSCWYGRKKAGFPTAGPRGCGRGGAAGPTSCPAAGFRAVCAHGSCAPALASGLLQEAGPGVRAPLGTHDPAGWCPAALPGTPRGGM